MVKLAKSQVVQFYLLLEGGQIYDKVKLSNLTPYLGGVNDPPYRRPFFGLTLYLRGVKFNDKVKLSNLTPYLGGGQPPPKEEDILS